MTIIQGMIDCKETAEIPVGSVVFITVSKDGNIIGHQTYQHIDAFPFKYHVDVTEEIKPKEAHEAVETWTVKVQIENGENTLFVNGAGNFMLSPHDTDLEKLDMQLNIYKS